MLKFLHKYVLKCQSPHLLNLFHLRLLMNLLLKQMWKQSSIMLHRRERGEGEDEEEEAEGEGEEEKSEGDEELRR